MCWRLGFCGSRRQRRLRRSPGSPLVFAARIGLLARPGFEAILPILNDWRPSGCTWVPCPLQDAAFVLE
jgi:hypothetical protein